MPLTAQKGQQSGCLLGIYPLFLQRALFWGQSGGSKFLHAESTDQLLTPDPGSMRLSLRIQMGVEEWGVCECLIYPQSLTQGWALRKQTIAKAFPMCPSLPHQAGPASLILHPQCPLFFANVCWGLLLPVAGWALSYIDQCFPNFCDDKNH